MILIGESLHVISPRIRAALETRDKSVIHDVAKKQAESGATYIDLNIGPQKKAGPEIMTWVVNTVQEVTDLPVSLDSINTAAIEAGLKVCKKKPLINSTDATEARMEALMPLAAKYKSYLIALTYAGGGLPTTADARIELANEKILPMAEKYGVPQTDLFLDPLVLTINGNQEQAQQTINAVRFFRQMSDPPLKSTCGLSNISNSAPKEMRPLINRIFLVMMMGAGLDSAIADVFDEDLMQAVKIIESRNDSTPKGKFYLSLYDAYAAMEEFDPGTVDASIPEIKDMVKTVAILDNKVLYAHGYLKL